MPGMNTLNEIIKETVEQIEECLGLIQDFFAELEEFASQVITSSQRPDDWDKPHRDSCKIRNWRPLMDQRYKILFVFGRRKRKKRRPGSGGAALIYHLSS